MELHGVRHVAVIMDGNGRWANERGEERCRGHAAGVNAVRDIVTECARAKLPWLSLYALSTENYRAHPRFKVMWLMVLLKKFLIDERPTLMENDVRLRSTGRIDELPAAVVKELRKTEALTAGNRGMTLVLALNYGGRREIADAARAIAEAAIAGKIDPAVVDEATVGRHLYDPTMPDVDLLVRTAGELRVSNFLLWQISYAEIWSTPICWPDFRKPHLVEALAAYAGRRRKFGGLLPGAGR